MNSTNNGIRYADQFSLVAILSTQLHVPSYKLAAVDWQLISNSVLSDDQLSNQLG